MSPDLSVVNGGVIVACVVGEQSVCSLLQSVGWGEAELSTLEVLLFDKSDAWRRAGCTHEQVTWPDVTHVFRTALCRARGVAVTYWTDEDEELYPALSKKNRLRFRITKHDLRRLLLGSWRMYCEPQDGQVPYSYGLVISHFDDSTLTFSGRGREKGTYEVMNGKVEYVNEQGRQNAFMVYEEVWSNGVRDRMRARLKSNSKFQCMSDAGYKQKARREESCTVGLEGGEGGAAKYFAGEQEVFENAKKRRRFVKKVCVYVYTMRTANVIITREAREGKP